MLASSGVHDIKYCFKTVSSELHDGFQEGWQTGNMPRSFKEDNASVCWDLESLECMNGEV